MSESPEHEHYFVDSPALLAARAPYEVTEPRGLRLVGAGRQTIAVPIRRLGLDVIELALPSDLRPSELSAGPLLLRGSGGGPLPLRVLGPRPVEGGGPADGQLFSFALAHDSLERGRRFGWLLRRLLSAQRIALPAPQIAFQERISDPERILRVCRAIVGAGRPGRLLLAGGWAPLQAPTVDRGADLPLSMRIREALPPPRPPFAIEFDGLYGVYRLWVGRARLEGGELRIGLPDSIERIRRRRWRRVAAPDGLRARFDHPVWGEIELDGALTDLSLGGLGLSLDRDPELLHPGLQIDPLRLRFGEGCELIGRGEVRSIRDAGRLGLSLDLADEPRARWARLVGQLQHPRTRAGAGLVDETWRLYEESGYFSLSGCTPERFTRLRDRFERASRKLDRAPDQGAQVSWISSDPARPAVEASIAFSRVFTESMLVFQLAKRKSAGASERHAGELLRDVHLRLYEEGMALGDVRWVLAYVQVRDHWSRLVHRDFPQRIRDGERAEVVPVRAIGVDTGYRLDRPAPGWSAGPATDAERDRILLALQRTRSRAWREAHDLVPERFALDQLRRRQAAAGMQRERACLVARRGDQAILAAILDLGEPGLHLYGLQDLARLVPLAPRTELGDPGALLAAAARWYAARGRERFVLFDEHQVCDPQESAWLTDLGPAEVTVTSLERLPDLLDEVNEVCWPRQTLAG